MDEGFKYKELKAERKIDKHVSLGLIKTVAINCFNEG